MKKTKIIAIFLLTIILGMSFGGSVLAACSDYTDETPCITATSDDCWWDAPDCRDCPSDITIPRTTRDECMECGGVWDSGTSKCTLGGSTKPDVTIPDVPGVPKSNLKDIITNILTVVMSFLGFVAVIVILIGGFQWMTSAGDDNKVSKAKGTISAGVIGLVIILSSWGIAVFVFESFGVSVGT